MYWVVGLESVEERAMPDEAHGRFVLHRHHDSEGPHLDLRLEQDGYLMGWRIEGVTFEGSPWATEKAPHPMRWLEQDGDAVREDRGSYAWLEQGSEQRRLVLHGQQGCRALCLERAPVVATSVVRSVWEALEEVEAPEESAGMLIRDGVTARRRAVERLIGLGRELDGDAFGEAIWRRSLEGLSLEEIQQQLRGFEVRFDRKYPAVSVSKPERLDVESGDRGELALSILEG